MSVDDKKEAELGEEILKIIQTDRNPAVVRTVSLNRYKRVIVVSDIHGDQDGFVQMLEHVKFSEEDAVVIVGDIIEKGAHSLELLRTVMHYADAGKLYAVEGNNEAIFVNWYYGKISDEDICGYVNSRNGSIISDMAKELNQEYGTAEDVRKLKAAVKENFKDEIKFLCGLPHILESEPAVFVHAGIQPGDLRNQDPEYCMKAAEFGCRQERFEHLVVVGHWPVSNYSGCKIVINSYCNKEANTISIDGGNSLKRWKQINYLIFVQNNHHLWEIQHGCYDALPKIQALDRQEENPEPFSLCFPHTRITRMKKLGDRICCYIPYLKRELWIHEDHIYRHINQYYCYDFTTYRLPVEAGEVLSYCGKLDDQNKIAELEGAAGKECAGSETAEGILVKRNGIVGNYYGRYVFL